MHLIWYTLVIEEVYSTLVEHSEFTEVAWAPYATSVIPLFTFWDNDLLNTIRATSLQTAVGGICIAENGHLITVQFPSLTTVGGFGF
jgi:hypothetical protein